jgi:hypothetical protein
VHDLAGEELNEELCVATYGLIYGRATMFGSEGPNGIRVSNVLLSFVDSANTRYT